MLNMNRAYITCVTLVFMSTATCEDAVEDYYGSDSDEIAEADYSDTLYDSDDLPLNLDGSLRQRLALNGAIADLSKSFVCSPLSALIPLGKLVFGAKDLCKTQLYDAIGVTSLLDVKRSFQSMFLDFKSINGVKLTICSRMYISKEATLKSDYEKDVKAIFKSSIKKVDMTKSSKVSKRINGWVSKKTGGMIDNIVSPKDIDKDSSLILVNAVYFSGQWRRPFGKPEMQTFYTAAETRSVPMMKAEGSYKYFKSDALDCQVVEIPYKRSQASFVIFLPNTRDGLPILLYKLKLAPELMQITLNKMISESLILSIPKFNTSVEIDLKNAYQQLGLAEMLKPKDSGLTGILEEKSKPLYISKAIQKAVIEVDENGTTASAASVVMGLGSAPMVQEAIKFNADHPFVYFVKIKKEIIFIGTHVA